MTHYCDGSKSYTWTAREVHLAFMKVNRAFTRRVVRPPRRFCFTVAVKSSVDVDGLPFTVSKKRYWNGTIYLHRCI